MPETRDRLFSLAASLCLATCDRVQIKTRLGGAESMPDGDSCSSLSMHFIYGAEGEAVPLHVAVDVYIDIVQQTPRPGSLQMLSQRSTCAAGVRQKPRPGSICISRIRSCTT